MARLMSWHRDELISRISKCREYHPRQRQEELPFPLEDILLEFYSRAELPAGPDFHMEEDLRRLLEEYKKIEPYFCHNLDELMDDGWFLSLMGRWESAMTRPGVYEEENLEDYPNGDIIAFLLWLDQEEDRHAAIVKIPKPESILKRWRSLYPSVPEVLWFVENYYLYCQEGQYYAINGHNWNRHVNAALAKLWKRWGEAGFAKWIRIARAVKGTEEVLDLLDEEQARELLLCMTRSCVKAYEAPDWQKADRFCARSRVLETRENAKDPERYFRTGILSGNRVLDTNRRNSFQFDRLTRSYAFFQDFLLVIHGMVSHFALFDDEDAEEMGNYINAFDQIGALIFFYRSRNAEMVYELLTNGNTMLLGLRLLLEEMPPEQDMSYAADILDQILTEGVREPGFLQAEEISACLLYLMCRQLQSNKGMQSGYGMLMERLTEAVGKRDVLQILAEGLCDAFEGFLELEEDSPWAKAFQMILFCMDIWFYRKPRMQDIPEFERMRGLAWKGVRQLFDPGRQCADYTNEKYLSVEICLDLYRHYIAEEKLGRKRKLLLPVGDIQGENRRNQLRYQYRLLLVFLHHILAAQGSDRDDTVKEAMIEALENVLLDDEPVFDYTMMRIFSVEGVLQQCIGMLSHEDQAAKRLMENLCRAKVPDLLIYYNAASDQVFRERLLRAIAKKADEDSLDVFETDRAVDLILQYRIKCLYPAVRKQLNSRLAMWEKRGAAANDFAKNARHQLDWLLYIEGKYEQLLAGKNEFFHAVVYMESSEHRNYKAASLLWRKMIDRRGTKPCGSPVFLNYLLLLNRWLEEAENDDQRGYLNGQADWITDIIEREEIAKWSQTTREQFCSLLVENRKLRGEDFLQELYACKAKYQTSLTAQDFLEEERAGTVRVWEESQPFSDDDIVNALCRFRCMMPEKRSSIYYAVRGVRIEGDMERILLVDKMLRVCDSLQHMGPQFIVEQVTMQDEQEPARERKLYEDHVTRIFCDIFNMACEEWYDMAMEAQREMGTDGKYSMGRKTPARVDIVQHRDCRIREIAEAFVLTEHTAYKTFQDHLGKAIGNNFCEEHLSFMLLYGNAQDGEKALSRYRRYLEERMINDITETKIREMEFPDIADASYYDERLMGTYSGIRLIRQRVMLSSGRKQEILHIFIDLAKEEAGELRLITTVQKRK